VTSLLTFAFLVAVFFSKAKLAGIVGPVILFAAVMPRYAFFSTDGTEMMTAKTITSFLSPTAFTFGADLLMQYEVRIHFLCSLWLLIPRSAALLDE
jgi:ATP-binding cassette subfamily A (ABC1) protein 3